MQIRTVQLVRTMGIISKHQGNLLVWLLPGIVVGPLLHITSSALLFPCTDLELESKSRFLFRMISSFSKKNFLFFFFATLSYENWYWIQSNKKQFIFCNFSMYMMLHKCTLTEWHVCVASSKIKVCCLFHEFEEIWSALNVFLFFHQDKLFAPCMVENRLGKSALSTHLHVWNWTPKNPRKCILESG